jgi:hypothetical protein
MRMLSGKAGVMNVTNKIRVGCLGGILDIEKFTQTTEVRIIAWLSYKD